ncbi:tetratricopeptide repeat protein [Oleispirillum naphthae]|uniref:tetratricopeptide repeat protein n=1 Tax=Oleispirillum naphthae TaxID=2838853 RepID=UPI0030823B02
MSRLRPMLRLILLVCAVLFAAPAAFAQSVEMRAGVHEGFGRIVFEWPQRTEYTARIAGDQLVVSFGSAVAADPAALVPRLNAYLRAARSENGGRRLVFDLAGRHTLRSSRYGNSVVLDLLPAPAASASSAAAPAPGAVPVRVGVHPGFVRIVFDWPRRPGVSTGLTDGRAFIRFDAPGRIDLARLRGLLPEAMRSVREDGRNPLAVSLPAAAAAKSFRTGAGGIAVDVPTAAAAEKPAPRSPAAPAAAEKPAPAKPAAKPAPGEPPPPAAAPVGAVSTVPQTPPTGRIVSLSFAWDQPTGAAMFRRGGYVWMVFDRPQTADISLMRRMGKGVIEDIEQIPSARATVVRALAPPNYNPSPRREGLLWIVDFMVQPLRPTQPIEVMPQLKAEGGARLFLPVNEGGNPISFTDPEIGDDMWVVPVIPLGSGIAPARRFVDAEMPVTAQGVVVIPRADEVAVATSRNGVEITRKGGLRLSGEAGAAVALAEPAGGGLSKAFDFKNWIKGGEDHFVEDERKLFDRVVAASDDRRNAARLDLARFYLAQGFGAEALGVLGVIAKDDPGSREQPDFLAVRGAALYLAYRSGEALKDLGHETLGGSGEAKFWRALAAAAAADKDARAEAVLTIRAGAPLLKDYPPTLRARIALAAAEAVADAGDDVGIRNFLDIAKRDGATPAEQAETLYLTGRMNATSGALETAIENWQKAEDTMVRPFRARAAFDRIVLMRKMGKITDAEAIDGLDRLRFAWRGDDFEYTLLKTLAEMDLSAKRYGEGLRVLKQMVSYFRDKPGAKDITELMRTTFRELYLNDRADDMPPVRAIALFEEFRELTPPGPEGDEMIRKLADRLVAVDLLDQAAALLDHQVETRLSGVEKSRIGARLALVHLFNQKPALALAALKKSETPETTPEMKRQREQLRARALADLNQPDNALKGLAEDNSDDANLLKAEIEWRRKNWAGAAEALARTVHAPEPGTQMQPAMRQRVLQWVTALRLSEQRREIAQVRRDYLPFMNATPEYDAFNLLTNRTQPGLIDMVAVEEQIKQAEKFRSFMGEYKTRTKAGGLSAIN